MRKSILLFCTLVFIIFISNNSRETKTAEDKSEVERVTNDLETGFESAGVELESDTDDLKEELDGVDDDD